MLVDAVAQLHQGSGIQPLPGDVAGDRLVENGLGGWAEGRSLSAAQVVVVFGLVIEFVIELVAGDQVVDQPNGELAGQRADSFVEVAIDDVVDAVLTGRSGFAPGDLVAGRPLEFQRDMLDDVAGPGALVQPLDEAAIAAA